MGEEPEIAGALRERLPVPSINGRWAALFLIWRLQMLDYVFEDDFARPRTLQKATGTVFRVHLNARACLYQSAHETHVGALSVRCIVDGSLSIESAAVKRIR